MNMVLKHIDDEAKRLYKNYWFERRYVNSELLCSSCSSLRFMNSADSQEFRAMVDAMREKVYDDFNNWRIKAGLGYFLS